MSEHFLYNINTYMEIHMVINENPLENINGKDDKK